MTSARSATEEEAWRDVSFRLENDPGFWFGLIAGDDRRPRRRLRDRAAAWCKEHGVPFSEHTRPPGELRMIAVDLSRADDHLDSNRLPETLRVTEEALTLAAPPFEADPAPWAGIRWARGWIECSLSHAWANGGKPRRPPRRASASSRARRWREGKRLPPFIHRYRSRLPSA